MKLSSCIFNNLFGFQNWKKERQVSTSDVQGGRCIQVCPGDPHYCWRKVNEVLAIVDDELSFSENQNTKSDKHNVFMYVLDGKVVGLLLAEPIDEAFKVIPDSTSESVGSDSNGRGKLVCCSDEPQTVMYGVSRLWVRSGYRRSGLATKMVNAFRGNVITYHYLRLQEFAFSDPTPSGLQFARNYTKKEDFLVYRHGM